MDGLLPSLLLSSLGDHTPCYPSHTPLWLYHLPLQGIPVPPSSGQDFSHISEFLPPFILTVPHNTLHSSAWTLFIHSINMLPEKKLDSCMDYAWICVVICVLQMLQEIIETQDLIVTSCFKDVLIC